MEQTLLLIAWQCVRELALAMVARKRRRCAARAGIQQDTPTAGQTMTEPVDPVLTGAPSGPPSRRVLGSHTSRRRRHACGG